MSEIGRDVSGSYEGLAEKSNTKHGPAGPLFSHEAPTVYTGAVDLTGNSQRALAEARRNAELENGVQVVDDDGDGVADWLENGKQ